MDDIEEKIEKEATTETFIRQATKCAVAKMCTNNRFEYIQESSLEILTELVLKGTRERKKEREREEEMNKKWNRKCPSAVSPTRSSEICRRRTSSYF